MCKEMQLTDGKKVGKIPPLSLLQPSWFTVEWPDGSHFSVKAHDRPLEVCQKSPKGISDHKKPDGLNAKCQVWWKPCTIPTVKLGHIPQPPQTLLLKYKTFKHVQYYISLISILFHCEFPKW
jgi:hypothetical protein